ncbi:MAG: TerC family protein, partial [Dongiaceae bacterium]
MEWLTSPEIWLSLLTLTALEIVLGVDNLVFIAVLVGKLPKAQQPRARNLGILMALLPRLVFLLA